MIRQRTLYLTYNFHSIRFWFVFNRYVDGANHWVQMDAPEVVNKHIQEFLAARH